MEGGWWQSTTVYYRLVDNGSLETLNAARQSTFVDFGTYQKAIALTKMVIKQRQAQSKN